MTLAIFWGIGIIVSSTYYILIRKKFELSISISILCCLAFLLFEIIGAKALFLLENIDNLDAYSFTITSGFSLLGVFAFSPFLIALLSIIIKIKPLKLLCYWAPGVLIELAFYRINCAIVGCCGGIVMNSIKAPTQIIEMCFDFFLFIVLLFILLKKNETTFLFSYVYLSYGTLRFILEFFRERNCLFSYFSIAHVITFCMIIIGISSICFIKMSKRKLDSF